MRQFSLLTIFILSFSLSSAQEATYTTEELTTYAKVMVWAATEKGSMTDTYNSWINNDDNLSAKRFLEIKNAKGDSLKIQDASVTIEELTSFDQIQFKYDSMTSSFKGIYIDKIKSDIGAGLYNRLKGSLKSDQTTKDKYDAIYEELKAEVVSEEDDTE